MPTARTRQPTACISATRTAPEVGAGWKHSGERAGTYISVVLDDPAFPFPVRARLFQSDEDGRDWGLHWTRPKKRDEQD